MKKSLSSRSRYILLAFILCVALGVRLFYITGNGYTYDVTLYKQWMRSAVELGVAQSYTNQVEGNQWPNYPPFSIEIFAGFGHIYKLFYGNNFDSGVQNVPLLIAVKAPAILADLVICLLLFFAFKKWKGDVLALIAAAIYAVHPASIADSSNWGQTDSIYTLFVFISVLFWVKRFPVCAGSFFALAILTKFQAIALAPLFGFFMIRDWRLIPRFLLGAAIAVILVAIPFSYPGGWRLWWDIYPNSLGSHVLTKSAWGLWMSLYGQAAWSKNDNDLLFGLVSFYNLGLFLYVVAVATILALFSKPLWKRDSNTIYLVASLLCFAFYLFPTQIHERYLYPFIVFCLPVAFLNPRKLLLLYIVASLIFAVHLLFHVGMNSWYTYMQNEIYQLNTFFAACNVFIFFLLFTIGYSTVNQISLRNAK